MGSELPIYDILPELLDAWRRVEVRRRFVIEAPTGSGKSTQLPQMLLGNGLLGDGEVVVLQPRRIAARMLAQRVAGEVGTRLGEVVGYQVRFERVVSKATRIRYVTEGILLREMMEDPGLAGITAIVFDEFHERHLYGDITLARAVEIQGGGRPDLALFVMSATLQSAALTSYLAPAVHLVSGGRMFPVVVKYTPQRMTLKGEVWDHAARVCGEALGLQKEGNALIFMPGAFEIRKTMEALGREKWAKGFDILPLHGELAPGRQDAAVMGGGVGRRRIVVATNVAETSLTIEGIRVVVDSGLARMAGWDANRGINTLTVEGISRASADQRAGRAGRTGPGVCYRLWSEEHHGRRSAATVPEIARLDLAEVLLTLKAAGVADLTGFRWFEAPDARAVERGVALLKELGALDAGGEITEAGRRLTRYPLHPRHARVMEAAREHGCVPAMALVVALLQGRPLFTGRAGEGERRFALPDDYSDFLAQLRGWQAAAECRFHPESCGSQGLNGMAAAEAGRLAERLQSLAGARGERWCLPEREMLGCVLLTAFSDQVARRTSSGGAACVVVGGRRGQVGKQSVIRGHELLLPAEIAEVEGREVQVTMQLLTEVEEEWLERCYPGDFSVHKGAVWDETQRRVMRRETVRFRDLVLRDRQSGEPDEGEAASLLAEEVMRGRLALPDWSEQTAQWMARLELLRKAMPEMGWPRFDEEDRRLVLEEMFTGCRSFREIKDLSPLGALREWLGYEKAQALDRHAPERVEVETGKKMKIDYTRPEEPSLHVFIQQLFTQKDTPRIAAGRVPLVLTILAPNHRPIQVTRDLAGFWKNHYPALKKEYERRYPRHKWPEMPT